MGLNIYLLTYFTLVHNNDPLRPTTRQENGRTIASLVEHKRPFMLRRANYSPNIRLGNYLRAEHHSPGEVTRWNQG